MSEDFPVAWARPEDARMAWRRDRWHAPDPITTLAADSLSVVQNGFQRGFRATGAPVAMAFQTINGYVYMGVGPARKDGLEPLGKEPQPDRAQNHAAWDNLWLPEIQDYHARWEAFDRENASDAELAAHIEESLLWAERCWEIHARLDFSTEGLLAFAQQQFGWDQARTQRMVAGLPNKSLESDERLRGLAAIVRDSAQLTDVFLNNQSEEVFAALPAGTEADAFRAALASFLSEFGKRFENELDPAAPSWADDPAPVLAIIRAYVSQPPRDHEAMRSRLTDSRETTIAEARELLSGSDPGLHEAFDHELAHAQRASELNETHNHWIDQQVTYWTQQNFRAAGRRFAARGIFESPTDVAHVSLSEILDGLRGNSTSRKADVEARKHDLARFRQMQAPLELGMKLPPEVAGGLDTVFGGHRTSGVANEVHGQAASGGVVIGTARIVLSLKDSDRIEEGDILVTKTTSPPWTPLFGIVSAVVTDAGGALSHCAIVAREYAIPAVVGCVDATDKIADGARIQVDGDTGVVTLLDA